MLDLAAVSDGVLNVLTDILVSSQCNPTWFSYYPEDKM